MTIGLKADSSNTFGTIQVNSTDYVWVTSSGNVGIGTSSPAVKLDVVGANNGTQLRFGNGRLYTYSTSIAGGYDNALLTLDSNSSVSQYAWSIAGSEKIRIDTSGNLIVGSNISTTGTGNISLYGALSTKTEIYMNRGNQIEGHIGFLGSTNSNWYFNTSSTLGNTGVYMANNATAWTSNSDERLKTDLSPIENAAAKVSTLRAVTGRYKTDEENVRRSFLIAQDVQRVLPEAISETQIEGDDTVYYGVAYTDTIPLLVAAIKEQQAMIEELKAEVDQLRAQLGAK